MVILVENYLTRGAHYVAQATGHTYHSVRDKANKLGLKARSGTDHWSEADLQLVREKYATLGTVGLAKLTGRTRAAVAGCARKLGLYQSTAIHACPTNWSDEHVALLREHYPAKGPAYVAELVGRKKGAVQAMAKRLGVRTSVRPRGRSPWSDEHVALVQKHYPAGMPLAELAEFVGRKPGTVEQKALAMGLRRPVRVKPAPAPKPVAKVKPTPKPVKAKPAPKPVSRFGYTPEQEQLVRSRFPHEDTEVLAEALGKKVDAVRHYAKTLGLVKSAEYLAARAARQADLKLVKKKAALQVEKKARKPAKSAEKKWWHYPMHSPEYKAGLASTTAGKKPTTIIDENGRPATVWRNAA